MSDSHSLPETFWALIDAALDGSITPPQAAEFQSILETNSEACAAYGRCARIEAELYLLARRRASQSAVAQEVARVSDAIAPQALPVPDADAPPPAAPMPLLGSLGHAWHRTGRFLSDHEYFTGNLVATLFFAVAALIASNVYVSTPEYSQYFAQDERQRDDYARHRDDSPQPARKDPREEKVQKGVLQFVGRVTGLVDCRWAAPGRKFGSATDYLVALHDKYELKSGLMEITYHTGAKVILQGPCTYEVESAAGGYLSLGKLTARVEKKGAGGAGRGTGEEAVASGEWLVASESTQSRNPEIPKSQNPSSLTTNHKPLATNLFAVRTPTAVVTDLGTEFGVEVSDKGATQSHVFRGSVAIRLVSTSGDAWNQNEQILKENESARIESGGDGKMAIVVAKNRSPADVTNDAKKFVRGISYASLNPYAAVVLEDKPAAFWPLDDDSKARFIIDRSGNGFHGRVVGTIRLDRKGPFANERSRAAEFDGKSYIEVDSPIPLDASKGFSVEAWVQVESALDDYRAVITSRNNRGGTNDTDVDLTGFVLYASLDGAWEFWTGAGISGQNWERLLGPKVAMNEWTHLAATFEPAAAAENGAYAGLKKLYINGELVKSESQLYVANQLRPLRIGAGQTEFLVGASHFNGRIAQVAVYAHSLAEERIKRRCEQHQGASP